MLALSCGPERVAIASQLLVALQETAAGAPQCLVRKEVTSSAPVSGVSALLTSSSRCSYDTSVVFLSTFNLVIL